MDPRMGDKIWIRERFRNVTIPPIFEYRVSQLAMPVDLPLSLHLGPWMIIMIYCQLIYSRLKYARRLLCRRTLR